MLEDAKVLAGLHGLRELQPGLGELLAALGLGLLLAAMITAVVRAFQDRSCHRAMTDLLVNIEDLPTAERVFLMAQLLREQTDRSNPGETPWVDRATARFGLEPGLFRDLHKALYRQDPGDLPPKLEAGLRRALDRVVG